MTEVHECDYCKKIVEKIYLTVEITTDLYYYGLRGPIKNEFCSKECLLKWSLKERNRELQELNIVLKIREEKLK